LIVSSTYYTIPLCDDDFHWRLVNLDLTGVQNSYISDGADPTATFASTTEYGLLSVILNGQFPQAFLTIQRAAKGESQVGNMSCNYVNACLNFAYSVIEMDCTPVEWYPTDVPFYNNGINTQTFPSCTPSAHSDASIQSVELLLFFIMAIVALS